MPGNGLVLLDGNHESSVSSRREFGETDEDFLAEAVTGNFQRLAGFELSERG